MRSIAPTLLSAALFAALASTPSYALLGTGSHAAAAVAAHKHAARTHAAALQPRKFSMFSSTSRSLLCLSRVLRPS
jgi:hypothetical protein